MKLNKLYPKVLHHQLEKSNPASILKAKYFYPDFGWTWYAIEEVDHDNKGRPIFFGFVDGDFAEYGNFSLGELMDTNGQLGCPIERDLWFKPTTVEKLRKQNLIRGI